jgi:hypothetical protein
VPPELILLELERLAMRLGIVVRAEAFDKTTIEGRGGLCWLRGRPVVVMDAGMPIVDKIGVLADALSRFDVEAIYLPPLLRARLERYREERTVRERPKAG